MSNEALIAGLNSAVPFATHAHVTVTAIGAATATATLPDRPELKNHIASQHAGALFTTAEAASGAVMMGSFGDLIGSVLALVREASIQYLKVARGPITAEAKLVGNAADIRAALTADGRTDFAVTVSLQDQTGLEVATARMAWSLRKRS